MKECIAEQARHNLFLRFAVSESKIMACIIWLHCFTADAKMPEDVLPTPSEVTWCKRTAKDINPGFYFYPLHSSPEFAVYLRRVGSPIHVERIDNITNGLQLAPHYLGPTNQFCGPIVLRDATGKLVPLLKPEVSSPANYPKSLSYLAVNAESRKYCELTYVYPDRFYCFLADSQIGELARFNLDDYFNMPLPGDFQLTVWPKIYEQSETNKDCYERIDLPSLNVTIHREKKATTPGS
jgi:hypothetical protein